MIIISVFWASSCPDAAGRQSLGQLHQTSGSHLECPPSYVCPPVPPSACSLHPGAGIPPRGHENYRVLQVHEDCPSTI
eukprot:364510-Chlamydomonas_euryale.AAC.13